MKEKGVPTSQRKYILKTREMLRRGILTFDYLGRRTTYALPEKSKK